MLAAVAGYFQKRLHPALLTAGTTSDVDAGELQHDLLKGFADLAPLSGQFEQTPDEGHVGGVIAVSQEAVMTDSDKALW